MSSLLTNRRSRGAVAAFASSALAFGGATAMLGAQPGQASSHREAPAILADPQAANTDVYAFVSPDRPGKVNLISNWNPFEEPAGGPNFYPFSDEAHYNIKIDNDGDAKADIIYRWNFNSTYENRNTFLYNTDVVDSLRDPDLNFKQYYSLKRIQTGKPGMTRTLIKRAPVAPSNVGEASMPNYAKLSNAAIRPYNKKRLSFAGQADDPFFLDLRLFDLLYGADLSETGDDTLSGYNVNTVAIQVPHWDLTAGRGPAADPVVGIWSTTERPSMRVLNADGTQKQSGKFVQISRLGNPLVNEVVLPVKLKDAFNALKPQDDASVTPAVNRVLFPEVPKLIEEIYGIEAPKTPRNDLFRVFFTGLKGLNKPMGTVQPAEMLRLNTSIPPSENPNRLGVIAGDNAGFPNGRRLADDVLDIDLQVLEGAVRTGKLNPAITDKVNANDKAFRQHFPYVALPHSGSDVNAGTDRAQSSSSQASASGVAPAAGSSSGETATAALTSPADQRAPWAPIAAGLGLAFGGLGAILLRRSRRQVAAT